MKNLMKLKIELLTSVFSTAINFYAALIKHIERTTYLTC